MPPLRRRMIHFSQLDCYGKFRHRFFDQVGHENAYVFAKNKIFSLKNVTVRPTKIINKADKD